MAERTEQIEKAFGDAFADEAVSERDYFLRLLQENGIAPYGIPGEEEPVNLSCCAQSKFDTK